MTTPNIVPLGFNGDRTDFLCARTDTFGAARINQGTVTVPTGTPADSLIGLIPFRKGARFALNESSIHLADIGAATTNVNAGYIYYDNALTDNLTAFRSGGTEIRAGGFLLIDEVAGMTFQAEGDGWLVIQPIIADTDADGDITFNVVNSYDG